LIQAHPTTTLARGWPPSNGAPGPAALTIDAARQERENVMSENVSIRTNVDWTLDDLVAGVGGRFAVVLSTDGILIQKSAHIEKDAADGLAAISSSLSSIARGITQQFGGGPVRQTIVEMNDQYLIVTAAGMNACLALLAGADADLGQVAYEMNRLVKRVGQHLATQRRDQGLTAADGSRD
jgi:predicted regulator of Ras-like GTPase activity (Roadblock/LC7/MglB family)